MSFGGEFDTDDFKARKRCVAKGSSENLQEQRSCLPRALEEIGTTLDLLALPSLIRSMLPLKSSSRSQQGPSPISW